MKTIKKTLPTTLENVNLYFLADKHIGDPLCDMKAIEAKIQEILNDPNGYAILGGDIINNSIIGSVGNAFEGNPMDQVNEAINLLKPLADAGKIICVVPGNHERRTTKTTGIDVTQVICMGLGLTEVYCPETAYIFLRFGMNEKGRRHCYQIYCSHGSGGGSRPGSKINKLQDVGNICVSDLVICGHTHLPAVFKERYYKASEQNSSIALCERTFVNTAAFLDYGGYGENFGFRPASKSQPVIHLNGKIKEITVTL